MYQVIFSLVTKYIRLHKAYFVITYYFLPSSSLLLDDKVIYIKRKSNTTF